MFKMLKMLKMLTIAAIAVTATGLAVITQAQAEPCEWIVNTCNVPCPFLIW